MAADRATLNHDILLVGCRRAQGVCAFGAIAINRNSLQPETPSLDIGLLDLLHRDLRRQIHSLRDGAGDERLHGAHHLQMSHVVDRAGAVRRFEGAIKNRQVLGFQTWSAFDSSPFVDVLHDRLHLGIVISEHPQRRGNSVVDDLDGAAADQFLVLHQRQVGLDARGVAIHHEADRPGRRQHRGLRIPIPVQHPEIHRIRPDAPRRVVHLGWNVVAIDPLHRLAMHAHDIQEWLPIDIEAGAWAQLARDPRRLQIRFASHHGGDRAGVIAAIVAVISDTLRHQQSS